MSGEGGEGRGRFKRKKKNILASLDVCQSRQATSELDILHPMLKLGLVCLLCTRILCQYSSGVEVCFPSTQVLRQDLSGVEACFTVQFGSLARNFRAKTRLVLKFVSRARTSCLCAEAVTAQSCFPCLVCETSRRLFRL